MENVVTNMIDIAADLALDYMSEGLLALWTGGGEVRDLFKTINLAKNLVNNAQDAVADWKSGTGSIANHFGILGATGPVPSIIANAPAIPVPI